MPSGSISTLPRIGRHTWTIAQRFLKRRSIAHDLAQAPRGRCFGVVVVHALHCRARIHRLLHIFIADADRVIEHDDFRSAGMLLDQRLHFGIVDAHTLSLIGKVFYLRVVLDEHESVSVEIKRVAQRPTVAHRHFVLAVLRRNRLVRHLRPVDIAHRRHAGIDDIVEFGANSIGGLLFGDELHRRLPQLGCVWMIALFREGSIKARRDNHPGTS